MVYVDDTIEGYIAIAKADKTVGEGLNIATQTEISIGEIARYIIGKINPEAKVITDDRRVRPEKSEVERLLGSNEKIRVLTSWKPKYTIESGLQETIGWFKKEAILKRYKPDIYNV